MRAREESNPASCARRSEAEDGDGERGTRAGGAKKRARAPLKSEIKRSTVGCVRECEKTPPADEPRERRRAAGASGFFFDLDAAPHGTQKPPFEGWTA